MNATRPIGCHAAVVALAALALALTACLLIRALGAVHEARELLAFRFSSPPKKAGEALGVALSNLRLVAAALLGAAVVRALPSFRPVLDVVLAAVLALNAVVFGVALGAYQLRLLRSVVLHGPLELAGFGLAGATYLAARVGDLTTAVLVRAGVESVLLIAAAAVAEAYLQLGKAS